MSFLRSKPSMTSPSTQGESKVLTEDLRARMIWHRHLCDLSSTTLALVHSAPALVAFLQFFEQLGRSLLWGLRTCLPQSPLPVTIPTMGSHYFLRSLPTGHLINKDLLPPF